MWRVSFYYYELVYMFSYCYDNSHQKSDPVLQYPNWNFSTTQILHVRELEDPFIYSDVNRFSVLSHMKLSSFRIKTNSHFCLQIITSTQLPQRVARHCGKWPVNKVTILNLPKLGADCRWHHFSGLEPTSHMHCPKVLCHWELIKIWHHLSGLEPTSHKHCPTVLCH